MPLPRFILKEGLKKVQTQNLAFGDGVNYRKYEKNPVITAADLPEWGSRFDFRDPKIWRTDDDFMAIIANDTEGVGGRMLLFRSVDLTKWEYVGVAATNGGRLGQMWVCPDFFALDGRQVLLASAQDMLPRGFEYHNGNGTFYLLGRFDPDTGRFSEQSDQAVDYGIDFYAPQTLLTPDGRRVMIGWMQNWDTCNLHTPSTPWFGQMSLPRELSVKDGRLYQRPLRELQSLRGQAVEYRDVAVEDGEVALPGIEGRTVEMEIEIAPDGALFNRFAVRFAKGDGRYTQVSFRPRESVVKVDRKFSGSRRAIIHQRRAKVRHDGGRLKLHLILDRFSVEAFIGEGEQVMSATLYTELSAQGISFYADGRAKFSVRAWALRE